MCNLKLIVPSMPRLFVIPLRKGYGLNIILMNSLGWGLFVGLKANLHALLYLSKKDKLIKIIDVV